jgi:hypothetical protein
MMVSMMGFGSYLGYGAISALLGAVAYSNLPTSITLGSTAPTVDYLAETKLKYIAPGKNIMEARDITVSY